MATTDELLERIKALEAINKGNIDKADLAEEIIDALCGDEEEGGPDGAVPGLTLLDYKDNYNGPLGGKSARILFKLKYGKDNRKTKYFAMNIYDGEDIQKAGERADQVVTAQLAQPTQFLLTNNDIENQLKFHRGGNWEATRRD